MKTIGVFVVLLSVLGYLLLVRNLSAPETKFTYKPQAAESTAPLWNKFDLNNYLFVSPLSLNGELQDIRDPNYRTDFFNRLNEELTRSKTQGVVLKNLGKCPPEEIEPDCPDWWELSLKDFVAQIRQYFTKQTVLFVASNDLQIDKHYLLSLNGAVISKNSYTQWQRAMSRLVDQSIMTAKIFIQD